jgi:mRNA-degrading endonuclease toxin of MazEF toxin-antitoxin module
VAALTSGDRAPLDVRTEVKEPEGGLRHDSPVLLNQILTLDKLRVGSVSPKAIQLVGRVLRISLGWYPSRFQALSAG